MCSNHFLSHAKQVTLEYAGECDLLLHNAFKFLVLLAIYHAKLLGLPFSLAEPSLEVVYGGQVGTPGVPAAGTTSGGIFLLQNREQFLYLLVRGQKLLRVVLCRIPFTFQVTLILREKDILVFEILIFIIELVPSR